jgi:hypothetical protein
MVAKPLGFTVYEGPSMLDGSPIVAIATGIRTPSNNRKTGAMVQVWILPLDASPLESVRTGADASVCGDCPLRGLLGKERACYVDLGKAPLGVWRAFHRGAYAEWSGEAFSRPLRLGAWGDPAALPADVLERLTSSAPKGHTGYTHAWRKLTGRKGRRYRSLLMASADSEADGRTARARGWRTFRVLPAASAAEGPILPGESPAEVWCPASPEGGDRSTCDRCKLCSGSSGRTDPRKSIAIRAHGPGARNLGPQ